MSRRKRILILHVGGSNGWVSKALLLSAINIKNCSVNYHKDLNSVIFKTWFQEQLLSSLPDNTVIMMNNASYYSKQINKNLTTSTKKAETLQYIIENHIKIPKPKCTEKNLLTIIKNVNISTKYRKNTLWHNQKNLCYCVSYLLPRIKSFWTYL